MITDYSLLDNKLKNFYKLARNDYHGLLEPLRENHLKYCKSCKDGISLVDCKELKNGDISYTVFNRLALKVQFRSSFTRLLIKNTILMNNNYCLGDKYIHPVKSCPDMQALDFEQGDDLSQYIYAFLSVAIRSSDKYQPPAEPEDNIAKRSPKRTKRKYFY